MVEQRSTNRQYWMDVDINALEADIAYFDARVAFIGDTPDTLYQQAMMRVYRLLEEKHTQTLEQLKASKAQK